MEDKKRKEKVDADLLAFPNKAKDYPKMRIREVDFTHIESQLREENLSPFELEIKRKIACVASPLELLIQGEEENHTYWKVKAMLRRLLRKASLTRRQQEAFRLIFLDGLTLLDAGRKLGIDRRSVWNLTQAVKGKLRRAARRMD